MPNFTMWSNETVKSGIDEKKDLVNLCSEQLSLEVSSLPEGDLISEEKTQLVTIHLKTSMEIGWAQFFT